MSLGAVVMQITRDQQAAAAEGPEAARRQMHRHIGVTLGVLKPLVIGAAFGPVGLAVGCMLVPFFAALGVAEETADDNVRSAASIATGAAQSVPK